jgi:uncharacterized protein YutE (UPF0331/DUF86 family)
MNTAAPQSQHASFFNKFLEEGGIISEELRDAIGLFWKSRNLVVHSHQPLPEDTTRRTVEAGINIVQALRNIELELIPKEKAQLGSIEASKQPADVRSL